MKMKRNWLILRGLALLLVLLIGFSLVGGCAKPAPPQDQSKGAEKPVETVKVGVIDCYTGAATTYTYDALDGFKLALEEIKEEGTLGFNIEFVTRDDEFSPDKSLNWAKELVMREEVDLLAGIINSAAALGVSQYAKEEKVPFLVWGSMSDKITGEAGHRYVFSMLPNTAIIGRSGAIQMSSMPYTKYFLAGSDYEYGHSVVNNFWENFTEMKPDATKVGELWWPVREPDFTPHISTIRAAKPEVVIVGTGGADMVPFLKAVNSTGLNKEVKIWVHTATDLSTLKPLGAEAPEGIFGTNPYHHYFPDTPENKTFVEAFKKAYGRAPAAFALNGYIAGHSIAGALRKLDTFDKEKFIDALEGLTIDSPVGPVTIREYDHQIISPMFFGTTVKSDEPFLVAGDIVTLSGKDVIPPVEKIQAKRK